MSSKCIECGTDFVPKRSTAKFCSDNCRVKFNKRNPPPSKKEQVAVMEDAVAELREKEESVVIEKAKPIVRDASLKETETDKKINKEFGEGTIRYFGDAPTGGFDVISSGSMKLDEALGIGGFPRGRIVEIFGWESSGKSTITLHTMANAQKRGLRCMLIDSENSFDPEYAAALNVDTEKLIYCLPDTGEQGLEIVDRKICNKEVDVVIVDSVAALVPKCILQGEMGDHRIGAHARMMSQACAKLVTSVNKNNVLLIFINQLRLKVGVMHGNPEVTTGGMALQFYSSIRVEVRRSTTNENSIIEDGVKVGNQTTAKVIKNKCAPPFRNAVFNIIYGEGVDRKEEIVDMAISHKIITASGTWLSYEGSKLGQGKGNALLTLENNPDVLSEIESKLLAIIKK